MEILLKTLAYMEIVYKLEYNEAFYTLLLEHGQHLLREYVSIRAEGEN